MIKMRVIPILHRVVEGKEITVEEYSRVLNWKRMVRDRIGVRDLEKEFDYLMDRLLLNTKIRD